MKQVFLFVVVGVGTLSAGCASYKLVSNEKDAWISHESGTGQTLYFCRSNPDSSGNSAPQCHEAQRLSPGGNLRSY